MTLSTALTFLFVLSDYWINASAPPARRGLVFGVYGTVLSIGFAFGPWFFAQIGSEGFTPFGVGIAIILVAAVPVLLAWRHSPEFHEEEKVSFLPYVFAVPTATAAVFVFGVVETGGFALFPLYGTGIGYSASNAALLLTMIGLGNVFLQLPVGVLSDRVRNRRNLLLACALVGLGGTMLMPFVATNWSILAALLFIWGGVVAGLYTVGLLHLGTNLSGRQLASANAAFVFCYALGALVGPQVIGVGMDAFGPNGFPLTLGIFFGLYVLLVALRLIFSRKPARAA
jgi:MFS family permease